MEMKYLYLTNIILIKMKKVARQKKNVIGNMNENMKKIFILRSKIFLNISLKLHNQKTSSLVSEAKIHSRFEI